MLGSAHRYLGDPAAARRSFARALELREALGDQQAISAAINNMALLAWTTATCPRRGSCTSGRWPSNASWATSNRWPSAGQPGRPARPHQPGDGRRPGLAEAAELAADLGNRQLIGTVRCNQGNLAARQQHWAEAAGHYAAATAAYQEAGHTHDAVEAIIGLGRAAHRLGQPARPPGSCVPRPRWPARSATSSGWPRRRPRWPDWAKPATWLKPAARRPDRPAGRGARLLAAGLSNKQIAVELQLSPATVERHLATIYRKLGVRGRVEAARYALAKVRACA